MKNISRIGDRKYILLPLIVFVLAAYCLPLFASASVNNHATNNVWDPRILQGPLVVCTGDGSGGFPCESLCDFLYQSVHVLYFAIAVIIWIVAPILIAWSGISLIMSRGNPEAQTNAKNRVTRIVLGLLIALSAYLIIATFVSVLHISGVGGFGAGICGG